MVRNLKLIRAIINHSSKRYLENRINTIGQFISASIEIVIYIFFISYIFNFTNNLNGWDKNQVLLLVGVAQLVSALYAFIFRRSVNRFPDLIRSGNFDYLLTKPISSQLFSSLRYAKPFEVLNSVTGLLIIIYALSRIGDQFGLINWLLLFTGIICGITVLYSLCFSFAILAFWSPKLESTSSIHEILSTPVTLPTDIYGQPVSFLITFIIPIGLVVTIPVKLFLGLTPVYFILVEIILTLTFLFGCIKFWQYAIKNYTSASS